MIPLLIAAAVAAVPIPAPEKRSGPMSGDELATLCRAESGTPALLCRTYLRGAFEGVMSTESALTGGAAVVCLPEGGVTLGDVMGAFLDYVAGAPERSGEVAGMLLLDSLRFRYPCAEELMGEEPPPPDGIA